MKCFSCGTALESLDVYGGDCCAKCLAKALEDFKLKEKRDLKAPAPAICKHGISTTPPAFCIPCFDLESLLKPMDTLLKPVQSDISEDVAWDAHCQRHHETEKALRTEIGRLNLIIADLHAAYCKSEMKASKAKLGAPALDDTKAISSFSGDYEFLSNFYLSSLHAKHDTLSKDYQPIVVPTLEHAFQAAKAANLEDFQAICRAQTPGQAKKLGRKIKLRTDWDEVKLAVMEALLREKFSFPVLRKKLLATGEAVLVEGNTWGDRYWGVCEDADKVVGGENHLGRLLMKLRAEFKGMK